MLGSKLANRYEILREIGRGGMGVVYLAHDPVLDREVAVKLITPEMVSPQSVERFKREARVVAKMDHHSIVSVYDSGEDLGSLFFVMPFVEGTNLRSLLKNATLTLGEVIEIGSQVASALDYSHARGIVHRDIKPENIMVERQAGEEVRVRITDFGLAMAASEDRLTKTATIVGTILYMSPEQVSGEELDAKSDIYSLGTVLYECLTGQPPFTGEVQALIYRINNEIPIPPRALQPQLDEEVENLLLRCLEKDPGKRPAGKEVHEKLSKYRSHLVDSGRYIAMLPTASIAGVQVQRQAARPFVGRDQEFAELQKRLNAAMSGECQLVLVGGEAGIGKTRLLDELETLSKVRNITVLHGRFAEIDRSLPYQAYCEAIQEYFRTKSASMSPADFSDLAGDLTSLFPVLAELRELATASDPGRGMAEGRAKKFEDRAYIFETLARTITRIAAGKPLVLLLEELHVADVSMDALDYIVRRLGPTPTLIVGTYRSTEVDKRHPVQKTISGFKGDKRFSHLQLGPLTPSSHRLFLQKLIGGKGLDDALAAKFFEATEGNPYFTNELVRSMIDSGGMVQDDTGVYKLSSETALSVEELPATIQQTIQERVERLAPELREVLSTASILGKTFDFGDLKIMAPDKRDLENSIEDLLLSGFLEEDRQSRGLQFSFSSGVLRDVLYGSVPRLRRRTFHRKYAEELEKRNQGRLERIYGQLFEHYTQADVPEKVIQFGFLLAQKSMESLSPEDAIRILQTVLDFLEYAAADPVENARAKAILGAAHRMKGNIEEALRHFEEAAVIFQQHAQDSAALEVITAAAETAWQGRKVEDSRRWLEKGIDLAANDETALPKFLSLGATIANLRGDFSKAHEYLDQLEKIKPAEEESTEIYSEGGTVTVAITSPFQSRHPVNATLLEESEVFSTAFETIVRTDEQGTLLPHLCERWETHSEGMMFLFVLRKEVTLQDGRRLTAAEIKAAIENAIHVCEHALPPGYSAIQGASEYQQRHRQDVSGIVALSENILQVQLRERLPIYPALLTDSRTEIVLPDTDGGGLLGSGPFKITSFKPESVVLERNQAYWTGKPAHISSLQFQVASNLASMLDGFRSGQYDIVRELQPQDLESVLRDRSFQPTFAEVSLKNVFFILFNQNSAVSSKPELRKALTGIVRTLDLVRSSLGNLGQPAEGFLPPGIFGHDPARRGHAIDPEKAKELIASAGITAPIRLRAAINPATERRYGSLLKSLFETWSQLDIEITNETPTTEAFLKSLSNSEDIDLVLLRWIGDYDDPDAFTYSLFHSEIGEFRSYCCSPELDALMTEARLEKNLERREKIYRRIENHLLNSALVFPLFHDVNYRLAAPNIRHLAVSNTPPFVNYNGLTKEIKPEATRVSRSERGVLRAPMIGTMTTLNPALQTTVAEALASPMIFETLTRAAEGARVIPWLASSFHSEDRGKRFHFHLRDGVRWHDGRRLNSRDVRYSFEHALSDSNSPGATYLSPVRGARKIFEGKTRELEGFHILSSQDFYVELEQPLSFFPALISNPSLAIIPEGLDNFTGNWRHGVVGTGPFRILSFDPGKTLKMEANPSYWRPEFPKVENLEFLMGLSAQEIITGFHDGRLSLAYFLEAADVESLLHDPRYAPRHKEIAWITTFYVSFNTRRPVFSDRNLRKKVTESLNVESLVRQTRRYAAPARTLIPPALLGFEPEKPVYQPISKFTDSEIVVSVSTAGLGALEKVTAGVLAALRDMGFRVRISEGIAERLVRQTNPEPDIFIINWAADYPDPDGVVFPLLYSGEGITAQHPVTPSIDRMIKQARSETDPDLRHSLYRRIEEEIREEAFVIPLLHDQFHVFARPDVHGLELNYFYPSINFESLSIRR